MLRARAGWMTRLLVVMMVLLASWWLQGALKKVVKDNTRAETQAVVAEEAGTPLLLGNSTSGSTSLMSS